MAARCRWSSAVGSRAGAAGVVGLVIQGRGAVHRTVFRAREAFTHASNASVTATCAGPGT